MFCSTRNLEISKNFKDITLNGYAEDGGLYVPKTIPQLSRGLLTEWKNLNYIDIVKKILALYVDDIPCEKLGEIIDESFKHFLQNETNEILPLVFQFFTLKF